MDLVILILLGVALAAGAGWYSNKQKKERMLMAAIDRLNAALTDLNTNAARLATGVDRVADEVAKLRQSEPAIEAAAVNVEGVNTLIKALADKNDVLVPPVANP